MMSLASSPGLFGVFITASRPASAQRWQTLRAALSPAAISSGVFRSLSAMIVKHSMPARTGKASIVAVEPKAHIGTKLIIIADNADSSPSQPCRPVPTSSSGVRRMIPSRPTPPSDIARQTLRAVVEVGSGDSAGALAGDRIGQNRDDRAEPLAVEFVAVLPEIGPLAPAERLDILERLSDRPMVDIDLAKGAQIGFPWRAHDWLQAGEDLRHAAFGALPRFSLGPAPFGLARRPRGDLFRRRFTSAGLPFADQRSHCVEESAPTEMHFESDGVAANSTPAAVPEVLCRPEREAVGAAAARASADQFPAFSSQFCAMALGDFDDRDRPGLVKFVFRKHDLTSLTRSRRLENSTSWNI